MLHGEEEILGDLPTQRLVYMVKALTAQIEKIDLGQHGVQAFLSESLKLLNCFLPAVSSIYDDFWTTLWDAVNRVMTDSRCSQPDALPLLHSCLKMFATYSRLVKEEANDDLVELWQDRNGPRTVMQRLVTALQQLGNCSEDLSSGAQLYSTGRDQPRTIVLGLLGRILATLPVGELDSIENLYDLLKSQDREMQGVIFDVLDRHVMNAQEQKSVDAALSKESMRLPQELIVLLTAPLSMSELNESTQTHETLWLGPRRYLLSWKLVFDHFTKAVSVIYYRITALKLIRWS